MLAIICAASAVVVTIQHVQSAASGTPTFMQTNLVSDIPGMAKITDPNLVNPWGMALGLNSGIWISQNGSGMATSYDGTGKALAPAVTIPAPDGSTGAPTGVATNATTGFVISQGTKSAPASELFSTEDGTIEGWNNSVDSSQAVIAVNNSPKAVPLTMPPWVRTEPSTSLVTNWQTTSGGEGLVVNNYAEVTAVV